MGNFESVHNGFKVVLNIGKKYSRKHNNRTDNREHTDIYKASHKAEKEHLNEYLIDYDLKEFLHQELDESIEQYNATQKRNDRKIDFDKFFTEKKGLARECIISVGNEFNQLTQQDYKLAFEQVLDYFKKTYPQLKIFGAYTHFDETTPHLHLDYIPIGADGKRKNLLKSVSEKGAFEEMGYTKGKKFDENFFHQFEEKFRNDLEDKIFKAFCPDLEKSEHSQRKHQEQRDYWKNKLNKEIDKSEKELKEIQEQKLNASKKNLFSKGNISIPQKEYEALLNDREKLKANYLYQNELEKAIQRQEALSKNAKSCEMRAINLYAQTEQIIEKRVNEELAKRSGELEKKKKSLDEKEKMLDESIEQVQALLDEIEGEKEIEKDI